MDERRKSLTALEWQALGSRANLSDGHARGWISSCHRAISNEISGFYKSSIYVDQGAVQAEFWQAFCKRSGQFTAATRMPFFFYSASEAVDAVGATLADMEFSTIGLITPTFDNLAALLQRRRVEVLSIEEKILWNRDYVDEVLASRRVNALFVVLPNNPTGVEVSEDHFGYLCSLCEERGIALVIDASFRFFSAMGTWDMYKYLADAAKLRWFVIEDTGKAFGLSELKVGMVSCDRPSMPWLEEVTDDLLLNVSPFVLRCLTFALETRLNGLDHLDELNEVIGTNRKYLRRKLSVITGVSYPRDESRLSVEWVRLPADVDASFMSLKLREAGIHVLPGAPFYWDDPLRGSGFVRLALARDPRYFETCIDLMVLNMLPYVGYAAET